MPSLVANPSRAAPRRSPWPVVAVVMLGVISVAACAGTDRREPPGHTIRDSAGVEIAEIASDPWRAPIWAALDTTNAMRILPNESRPETLFGRVRGALRLADSSIAVLDIGRYEVRIFAADGSYIRSIGRQGQGPGEFDSPWRLVRAPGDSLGVVDLSGRLELIAVRRDGSRRIAMPRGSDNGTPQILGSFAGGGYLAILNEFSGKPQPGANRLHSTLHVVTDAGASGPTLGRHQSAQFTYRKGDDGRLREVPTLFWAEPGMAVLPAGYAWCLATEFDCQIRSSTGIHLRTIRAPVITDPITSDDVAELRRVQLERLATPRDSARVNATIDEADRMDHYPVLSLIRTDSRARIWMRAYVWREADRVARWLVFEPSGRVLGTVTMPAGLQVFDIGEDYVLGVERDEDDTEGIVLYPYAVAR